MARYATLLLVQKAVSYMLLPELFFFVKLSLQQMMQLTTHDLNLSLDFSDKNILLVPF